MGRKKIAQVRELASTRGWLAPNIALPDDAVLASALARKEPLPSTCISTLEPWRAQIGNWYAAGIQGTTIHATLVRNHGYTGSYSAVYRVADISNQRKSPSRAPLGKPPKLVSTRFARKGPKKEFEVRDTRTRMLNRARETAIRFVLIPAMRTEYASVPIR